MGNKLKKLLRHPSRKRIAYREKQIADLEIKIAEHKRIIDKYRSIIPENGLIECNEAQLQMKIKRKENLEILNTMDREILKGRP